MEFKTTSDTARDFAALGLGENLDLSELAEACALGADWTWETDEEHRFRWISQGVKEHLGLDPARLVGISRLTLLRRVAPRDVTVAAHLDQLEAGKPFRDFVYAVDDADGRRRWVAVSGDPLKDAQGQFRGYRGIGRDVTGMLAAVDELDETNRKLSMLEGKASVLEAEAAGNSQAERLVAALNAMNEAVCFYDSDDRLVIYNEAMVSMYCGMEDVIRPGTSFEEFIDSGLKRGIWRTGEAGPKAFRETMVDKKRGGTGSQSVLEFSNGRWVMHREMRTADGGTIGIATDITDLKRNEDRLERAREEAEAAKQRLQTAMDALEDGFVLWDSEDRLVAYNKAFERQMAFLPDIEVGRKADELLLRFAQTGVVKEAVGREKEWVAENLAKRQEELGQEIIFRTHDDRWIMRRDQLTPVGDRVGIRSDVTEHKRREEQLEAAKERAEKILEDLKRMLDNMQMGVVVLDSDLRVEIVNPAYCKLWNVDPGQVAVGSSAHQLMEASRKSGAYDIPDEEWAAYVEQRLDAIRAGEVHDCEFRRADGRTMIYSVIPLSDGKRLVTYYDVTAMKEREAELALALEKARLAEAVIDNVPDPMFVKDGELRFVMANRAFAEEFDTTPQAVIGARAADFLSQEKAADFEAIERAVLETGEMFEDEEHFEISGVERSRMVRKNRVTTDSGSAYLACSVFDITEMKRRENDAIEARRHLANVLETLPAGVIIYDSDDKFVLANSKLHEAHPALVPAMQPGKSLRESVEMAHAAGYFRQSGDPELDRIYDTDPQAWIEGYLAGYRVKENIFERRIPDGRWVKAFDMRLDDGTFVGVRVDISELKEREDALRASMGQIELLSHVLDELPVAAYVKSDALEFEFVNKAWSAMSGVPKEEAIGKTDHDFFGKEAQGFAARDSKVLATGWMDETEETLTHRDGRVRHLMARKGRLVGHDGRVHLIGSSSDITELKQREAELQEAQRKAVLADRAKSEFLANMSHEIRTPMNGVLGMAELLAKSELDAKQKTFTDIIMKSGNALLTIINDILDFSKIDAGQLVLDPAPFNLAEAIEDVATLMSTRAKEKDLEMIVRFQPDLPEQHVGDAGRLRQIVTNLMGNAIKFTEAGHVLVEVTGEMVDGETSLRISVTDTGIGIPAEMLDLVFDKFSQVDASSTRRHEGTGLGLAITSRLVEMMGGRIGVESTEGKGSTFWFTVTLPHAAGAAKRRVMPVDVSGARVLVVDDNAVNRSILIEQMSSWGFDSCAAESGDEGLRVLQAAHGQGIHVDCLVLDHQMPGMSGADMARRLRATDGIRDIPIVLLTSVDHLLSSGMNRELAIDAQLTKPARSSALLEAVVETIQKNRGKPDSKRLGSDGLAMEAMAPQDGAPSESQAVPARARHEQRQSRRAKDETDRHRVDILVAEDNEVNQLVFTQILSETGLTFEIVGNGALAVEACRNMRPRMILMDVSMPQMNGLEATARIREMEQASGARTPVIGVTAHALKGDRERCLESGMDDYLSKPISPKALTDKIAKWSGGADEWQAARA